MNTSATKRCHADQDEALLHEAAEWFALLASEDVAEDDREAWRAWCDRSPAHRRAWARIEAVSERFERLRATDDRSTAESALEALRNQRYGRRKALKHLAVFAGVGLAGWASLKHTPLSDTLMAWGADYRTGVGERTDFELADGSRVWLNTASALDVWFDDHERRVVLLRGEILVQTAPDRSRRPFRVEAPTGTLQALGTRFNVRLDDEGAQVAVYDGRVALQADAGSNGPVVETGQRVRLTRNGIGPVEAADPVGAAWTRGRLVADHMLLGELVAELGRYRHGVLTVAPEVADLPVMGTYPLDDIDHAFVMLEQALPIRVRRVLPGWIRIESR